MIKVSCILFNSTFLKSRRVDKESTNNERLLFLKSSEFIKKNHWDIFFSHIFRFLLSGQLCVTLDLNTFDGMSTKLEHAWLNTSTHGVTYIHTVLLLTVCQNLNTVLLLTRANQQSIQTYLNILIIRYQSILTIVNEI